MDQESIEKRLNRGYRYALALTHDVSQAEDLLHDAWIATHRSASSHRQRVPYLLKTIRNRFIDLRRRQQRFPHVSMERASSASRNAAVERSRLDAVALERALGELRSIERELLFLTAVEGYTVREAAELTDRPLGTVSSALQRAKTKLRTLLTERDRRVAT